MAFWRAGFFPANQSFLKFIIKMAYLHIQKQNGFLEGRLFSSQSELFESFLNCSDWLEKS